MEIPKTRADLVQQNKARDEIRRLENENRRYRELDHIERLTDENKAHKKKHGELGITDEGVDPARQMLEAHGVKVTDLARGE